MKTLSTMLLVTIAVATTLLTVPLAAQQGTGMGDMKMGPQHNDAHASMAAMSDKLRPLKGKEFEVEFLKEMISHHQSAVDMAKLVPTNTKRPELNKLAASIIADQEKEIAQMTGWLTSWYGQQPEGMAMQMPGMDKLKTAKDAEFDKMWVSMMIEHHQGAVDMSKLVADRGEHAELKTLASSIIKSQNQEIEQMQKWQKEWH